MHGRRADAVALARTIVEDMTRVSPQVSVGLCPPATLLTPLAEVLAGSGISLGGQDCHPESEGAHTGDIAAEMLADAGCSLVIVGHSERRVDHGETDTLVARKAAAAHRAGLDAIICVGESLEQRENGSAVETVLQQVRGSLPETAGVANTLIAYEPVWAIGTGKTPLSSDIEEMHGALRGILGAHLTDGDSMPILYGGSVKAANAAALLAAADVDGALVGGASLDATQFMAIVEAAEQSPVG